MIGLICFELQLDGLRGLADAVNGPDAVEERQPDEAVQRRLHRQWTTGADRTEKHVKHESM
jgi:hypothetical protein